MAIHTFETAEVDRFAQLSGDFNPLHCDPVAARRRLGGHQLVHGLFVTLWALNDALPEGGPCRFKRIKASFGKPISVGMQIESHIKSAEPSGPQVIEIVEPSASSVPRFHIEFEVVHAQAASSLPPLPPSGEAPPTCIEHDYDSAAGCSGELALFLDPEEFEAIFPRLAKHIPADQAAALLATTRLIGMQCPGLHSIFQSLEIDFNEAPETRGPVTYRVEKTDRRFSRLVLAIESESERGAERERKREPNWLTARLDSFHRPPQRQPSYADLQPLLTTGEFAGLRALVVGGSRGIGEVAAKLLAAGGADTRTTHYRGVDDALRVCDEIRSGGGSCQSFPLNVEAEPDAVHEELAAGLGDWVPNLCVYMATPAIDMEARPDFSADLLSRYTHFYVTAFENLVGWILELSKTPLKVLYPSTVTIDTPVPWSREYAEAKATGEALCQRLQALEPRLQIAWPRFPRVETDQTATLYPTESSEVGPLVLEHLRQVHRPKA
jgi:hypothetical protein